MNYPIVIPLHHGGGKLKNNTELRYALRSLAKHFKDECEIAIVGRKLPEWAQGVRHIESREGLKTALIDAAKAYPEGFFWWYDDLCLLKDITGEEMKVTPACKGWGKPKTGWSRRLDEIRQRLVAEGRPAWDYSRPHGPYWFDLAMVEEGFADWPGMKSKFPWESWILSKRDWPRRHGVVKQYYGGFREAPGNEAWFVNYNDKGNTGELREWLGERFGEGCGFERPPLEITPESHSQVQATVIALPQRPRWETQCVEELKPWGIDAALFPGIDGHDPDHEKVMPVNAGAFRRSFKHEPLPGEIGCFSSHIKIARAATDLPPLHPSLPEWRLVFEDDAVSLGMTGDKLCEIANMATEQGYDLVMLHTGRNNRRGGTEDSSLTITKGRDIFTHAYLAKLSAFREMSGWEMRHPIDHAISRSKKLRVAVLWGNARFDQRPPLTSAQSIHRERKAAYAGKSEIYEASPQEEFAIPALHQIWIGHAPIPPRLAAYCEGMRAAFPGWSYRLWDERSMRELAENAVLPKVVLGEDVWGRPGLPTGIRADVVRLEVLRQHGGVYFDCDYEALRKDLRALFRGMRGFVYSDQRNGEPGNGLLGADRPGHPFVSLYLRRIAAFLEAPKRAGDVLQQSGPPRLAECLHYWMGHWRNGKPVFHEGERVAMKYEDEDVAAFFAWIAHPYFYQKGTWATFDPLVNPTAWAVHHWAESWK